MQRDQQIENLNCAPWNFLGPVSSCRKKKNSVFYEMTSMHWWVFRSFRGCRVAPLRIGRVLLEQTLSWVALCSTPCLLLFVIAGRYENRVYTNKKSQWKVERRYTAKSKRIGNREQQQSDDTGRGSVESGARMPFRSRLPFPFLPYAFPKCRLPCVSIWNHRFWCCLYFSSLVFHDAPCFASYTLCLDSARVPYRSLYMPPAVFPVLSPFNCKRSPPAFFISLYHKYLFLQVYTLATIGELTMLTKHPLITV